MWTRLSQFKAMIADVGNCNNSIAQFSDKLDAVKKHGAVCVVVNRDDISLI